MMEDLSEAKAGDVVLLHGCCHNPTGANLNLTQWQAVVDLLNEKGLVPMIDIAYQGFGDGLEEDAAATRLVASSCAGASDRGQLFEELWCVPRAHRPILMAISEQADNTGGDAGQPEPPEPPELFLPAGSRGACGDHDPDR